MRKLLTATAALLLAGTLTAATQQSGPKRPQPPNLGNESGMPGDQGTRAGQGKGMNRPGTTGQGTIGGPADQSQPGGKPAVEPPQGSEPAKPAPTR